MSAEIIRFGKPPLAAMRRPRKARDKAGAPTSASQARKLAWWSEFGERLQLARSRLGITKDEAAAALRLTLRTYEKWESGKPGRSNHSGVFCFAETYGLTLDWLIAGDGEPPRFRPRLVS
jgi:DNA-binding XRE family transcriptional regulator